MFPIYLEDRMNYRTALGVGMGLLLGLLLPFPLVLGQQQNNTPLAYIGQIMDSKCASQHYHEQMMTKEGIKTSKDCTLLCIKDGAKFVLYNAETKASYNLDDQDKPQEYAGEKVSVVGTYDGPSMTIHIQSITVVP